MKITLSFVTTLLLLFACTSKEPVQQDTIAAEMKFEKISITGMSCTGCEETIAAGVASVDGVQDTRADYVNGTAWVLYDASKASHDQLTLAIESKGYKVTAFESFETDSAAALLN